MKLENLVQVSLTRRCAPRVVSRRFARTHNVRPNLAAFPRKIVTGFVITFACAHSHPIWDGHLRRSIRAAGLLRQIESA